MLKKTYRYSLLYKLNFVPGLSFILCLFIIVRILPSTSKIYGYLFLTCLLIYYLSLVIIEKIKVANVVIVDNESVTFEIYFRNDVSIKYDDMTALNFTGKGLYLSSWKIVRYLYAEVISKDGAKIVFRREINDFDGLVQLIESKTGKVFKPN